MPRGCNEYNYILKDKGSRYAYSNDYVDGYIPNENTYDMSEEIATYNPDILTSRAAFMVYPAEMDEDGDGNSAYRIEHPADEFISTFEDGGGECGNYAKGYGRKKLYDEQIEDFANMFGKTGCSDIDDILLYLFVFVVVLIVACVICHYMGGGRRYCPGTGLGSEWF